MKNLITVLCLLSLSLSNQSPEIVYEFGTKKIRNWYYKDGTIESVEVVNLHSKKIFRYLPNGNLISEQEYSVNNVMLSSIDYFGNGLIKTITKYKYGNISHKSTFYPNGSFL